MKIAVERWASYLKLDPDLLVAIIRQESDGRIHALRFEEHWRYLERPELFAKRLGTTIETELKLQCFSYGLMQVMGSVARELGFVYELPLLLDVATNIQYGALKLKTYMVRYRDKIEDAIASYNAGSVRINLLSKYENQDYVDSVLRFYAMKLFTNT